MGKSPGKWIKTLLFGKKASRTHSSKARDASKTGNDKNYLGGKGSTALTVSSPVISEPVLVSSNGRGSIAEIGKGVTSNVANDETVQPPVHPDEHKLEHPVSDFSNGFERVKKEQAAVKAQAAFRGYLARRAFRALKGIIRLQALVRGHLVRRQGVATLRAILAIVKLQAVARGWKIRHFGVGFEVNAKSCNAEAVEVKPVGTWHEKVLTNVFVRKLLASAPRVMPLHIQHNQGEPNSTLIWLERWTYCRIWKSVSQSKKTADPKPHAKRSNYAMETESGRQKRIPRKNPTASVDSGAANIVSEPDKPKRNLRKVSGSMVDSLQEHPQSELEKVKRNLRKVSNLTAEASIRPDIETEKPICSLRKVSSPPPEALGQAVEDSTEKTKKDDPPAPETKPDVEVTQETVTEDGPGYVDMDTCPTVEVNQLQSHDKEENMTTNEVISSKDEQTYTETLRTSKRRSSFSSKSEYAENGSPNTPTLPSYMATTESAKAKLRAQNSPRFGSDSGDKSGFTRRHSLPSSTNGKMSSQSPRTQRLIQASGKGGLRNDRSLTTSRDGTDRHIQVEWRR